MVESQAEHLSQFGRQGLDGLVQGGPHVQFGGRGVGRGWVGLAEAVGRPQGARAGQVSEFPTELLGSRPVESSDGVRSDRPEGPVESDEGVLKDVPGLLLIPHLWKVAEHLAGQVFQPVPGPPNERVEGRAVPPGGGPPGLAGWRSEGWGP